MVVFPTRRKIAPFHPMPGNLIPFHVELPEPLKLGSDRRMKTWDNAAFYRNDVLGFREQFGRV
jgi:hypothetical protein